MTDATYYQVEGALWSMKFSSQATAEMQTYAQTHAGLCESVGQLYSRDLTGHHLLIEHATRLPPRRASRGRVQFDPRRALAERKLLFRQGLHCVGLWHTHPEPYPEPSEEDRTLARDYAAAAKPVLTGIVFVIVGTLPPPNALRVWIADEENLLTAPQKFGIPHT